ncbi:hypothetical protein LTR91_027206, partial [Friedmanniomyces endolithicus]
MDPHPPHLLRLPASRTLDKRRSLRIPALRPFLPATPAPLDRVFLVIRDIQIDAQILEGGGQGAEGAIADAGDVVFVAVDFDYA